MRAVLTESKGRRSEVVIPPHLGRLIDNAERMLRRGESPASVVESARRLGLDAELAEELLRDAQERIARDGRRVGTSRTRRRLLVTVAHMCLLVALILLAFAAFGPGSSVLGGLVKLAGLALATSITGFVPALITGHLMKGDLELHEWIDSNEEIWGPVLGASCVIVALLAYRLWS